MSVADSIEAINGCATRVMRKGKGAPLLFLHGANGAPAWLPFMETLAERFDVIVPEHPGFGGSDMPDWLDNIGDLAYFYLDFIEHFGLDGYPPRRAVARRLDRGRACGAQRHQPQDADAGRALPAST